MGARTIQRAMKAQIAPPKVAVEARPCAWAGRATSGASDRGPRGSPRRPSGANGRSPASGWTRRAVRRRIAWPGGPPGGSRGCDRGRAENPIRKACSATRLLLSMIGIFATHCGTRPRKVCTPQFRRTQRASGLRPSRRSLPRGLHGPDRELDRYRALARTSATSATSTLSQRAERAAIYSSLRARAGRELAYVAVARLATPWTLLGTTDAPRRIGFPRLRAAALLSRS